MVENRGLLEIAEQKCLFVFDQTVRIVFHRIFPVLNQLLCSCSTSWHHMNAFPNLAYGNALVVSKQQNVSDLLVYGWVVYHRQGTRACLVLY